MIETREESTPLLFGRNATAQRLGVSVRCVDELMATKALPSIKIGKRRLCTAKAIDKFIKDREREAS